MLSRHPRPAPWRVVAWDGVTPGGWIDELDHADVWVNLAGRSVNCRYTAASRRAIRESRVRSTLLLHQALARLQHPPAIWINASTAITLSPDPGGVFDVLLGLVRRGLGGTQGPGTQFVSWIHHADFVRALDLLIDREDFSGIVNIASPNPLPNCGFLRVLREAWGARIGPKVPQPLLEIGAFLLRTESELVLKSRRVVPGRLLASGFEFLFPEWPAAARDLVNQWRARRGPPRDFRAV